MKKQDFVMTWDEIQIEINKSKKGVGIVDLEKLENIEKDLQKYKWLYKIACEVIHDIDGVELEDVHKDFEKLWELFKDRRGKNVN